MSAGAPPGYVTTYGDLQRRLLEDEDVPFRGARVDAAVARIPHDAIL